MLTSKKIELRRSEIRQSLAELAANDNPSEEETRKMGELDTEYRSAEVRYRAAIISEDEERREAGEELETRSDKEWSDLMGNFEMRQVALALDEGAALSGQTQEIVTELRNSGGYRGVPVPWEALEIRAGETTSATTPNPIRTAPIIERLFAGSVAAQMGGSMVNVGVGDMEYPVATSKVTAGWAATETGDVPGSTAYTTIDRPLKPDHNLGVQMRITRKALKQSGSALEQAVRRDMNGAVEEALDKAVFQGSGAAGEPTGLFTGAAAWGIIEVDVDAAASWGVFRNEVTEFMIQNAASGPSAVRLLMRPEIWNGMDGDLVSGTAISEWDRMREKIGSVVMSSNALGSPTGDPAASTCVLTTNSTGVAPFYVGAWGAIDLIRDPYSDAQSGGLRITALTTMDVTVSRSVQTRILNGVQ